MNDNNVYVYVFKIGELYKGRRAGKTRLQAVGKQMRNGSNSWDFKLSQKKMVKIQETIACVSNILHGLRYIFENK